MSMLIVLICIFSRKYFLPFKKCTMPKESRKGEGEMRSWLMDESYSDIRRKKFWVLLHNRVTTANSNLPYISKC
jgi:hypothetical protein